MPELRICIETYTSNNAVMETAGQNMHICDEPGLYCCHHPTSLPGTAQDQAVLPTPSPLPPREQLNLVELTVPRKANGLSTDYLNPQLVRKAYLMTSFHVFLCLLILSLPLKNALFKY